MTTETAVEKLARNLNVPASLIQDAITEVATEIAKDEAHEAIFRHENPDY